MRGRRLQVFIGVVGVVVVAAVSVAVARIGGDSGTTDVRAEGERATTAGVAGTVPVTSAPPAPPTLEPSAPATTSPAAAGPGPPPAGPAPETPGPTEPPAADCAPAEILVTAAPDQSTYARGEDVTVTAAARNQAARPCDPRDPSVEIRDKAGGLAFRVGAADFTSPAVPWPPGAELSKAFTWNRTVCTDEGCRRAIPGPYTATAVFGEYRSAPANFTIL